MSAQIILDNEYVTLWYHPEAKIVHHQFHKFIHGAQFRAVLDKGLEIFKQYGAIKWLSDDRGNSAVSKEDSEWGQYDWTPRVFASGWKYWAVVMPDKVVGQTNMNWFMRENIELGLVVKVFEDADEALHWLETVD